MEITSATFREVEFREKRHGYHPEDVDSFLERMGVAADELQGRLRGAIERARLAEEAQKAGGDAEGRDDGSTRERDSEDAIRRTLVLAQRTADAAVREAREEADRILSSARQEATALVAAAEEEARQTHDDRIGEARAELARLEATRAEAQDEVDVLNRWSEQHRAQLSAMLQEASAVVDRAGPLAPPPSSRPIEGAVPPDDNAADVDEATGTGTAGEADAPEVGGETATSDGPAGAGPTPEPAGAETEVPSASSDAPSPAGWGSPATAGAAASPLPGVDAEAGSAATVAAGDGPPTHNGRVAVPAGPAVGPASVAAVGPAAATASPQPELGSGRSVLLPRPPRPEPEGPDREGPIVLTARGVDPPERNMLTDPDEQAIDDFFQGGAPGDDRRFGGRLRRKR
jgi:DivIVA domain-containing protein